MIFSAVTGQLKMILIGIAGATLIATGLAIAWLWNSRESLLEINAAQEAAINNVVQANADNLITIDELINDAQWRDQKAIERSQREQRMNSQLDKTRKELKRALKDAPDCVNQPWPDAVFDIMRRNTVRDPHRESAGNSASGVSAADSDTRPGS